MNKKVFLGIGIFLALYLSLNAIANYYVDYEWFRIHKGQTVFWVLFSTRFVVHALFSFIFIALFFMNFFLIRLMGGRSRIFTRQILDKLNFSFIPDPRRTMKLILAAGILVIGFFMGMAASAYWKEFLMFRNGVPFDAKIFPVDPIFHANAGFYVFTLPFLDFLYGWLMASLVIILLFSLFFHVLNSGIYLGAGKIELSLFARAHLSTLLAGMVLLFGLSYRLSAYNLLFSSADKFFGPGYTAASTKLYACHVAMGISFLAAALLLFNIVKKSFKLPFMVFAVIIPAYFVLNVIVPSIQQKFFVEPNELNLERPYIKNNIQFTRLAYDIERVKVNDFANSQDLTFNDIARNKEVLESVRLWDWRPLKLTYNKIQSLRPYYTFNDVDIDRYPIDGRQVAVNVSARELNIEALPSGSASWQNQHLVYTHGYGAVMNRVDRITPEGLPEMIVSNIPPVTATPGLQITRPQIYFGEHQNPYVITNSTAGKGEFDYPAGHTNIHSNYEGDGGTLLDSRFKRLLFAAAFQDANIMISRNISPKSRILYSRNIMDMAEKIAPFLVFDGDPYLVNAEGKLYWIIDAYTTTENFPYSTPSWYGERRINYIRNSVKIIVDAYTGVMNLHVMDENDPLIKVYQRIFPGVFQKGDAIPAPLKAHLRYPAGIFEIQANMLSAYHMNDPDLFYYKEDIWEISKQKYEDTIEPVQSYYILTKLPGGTGSEFMIILPFSPEKKDNLLAFLIARCDQPGYGDLNLYRLPKGKLSYGPHLVESRIDQDTEISKQLTLWGQKGSSVIRGNMLLLPIEDAIIYIEPLYLQAESGKMPELKRVIVAYGNAIVMEENLQAALEKLFYKGRFIAETDSRDSLEVRLKDLAAKAYNHYLQAEQHMRAGNWNQYGEELKNIRNILEHMRSIR